MVATTFAADTPNLVTDLVRSRGVSGNWLWWAFLLTGMLTVFVYARLWRRSGLLTDLEFYELRYSGRPAAFLRGFRAVYLGLLFNVIIMASGTLAVIKIGGIFFDSSPVVTVAVAAALTVAYSALGGLRGVLVTDLFQFLLALGGATVAALWLVGLPEVGGLAGLLAHDNVRWALPLLPDFSDQEALVALLVIPLAVQWWSVWYPGAEPGGGGYVAQRMLAARSEDQALSATLLFNVAHYALRPWPWILVALASLVVFPDLGALAARFPRLDPSIVRDDLAYPAMLSLLPSGLLGLLLASLFAAYMSTISTHLNWGSSYLVHDLYRRFLNPQADERRLVLAGRLATLGLMLLAGLLALALEQALQAFNILLQIGAGTGALFILRWFWWRINAFSELAAMVLSFAVALWFEFGQEAAGLPELSTWQELLIGVGLTTAGWLAVTFLTRPTDSAVLLEFYRKIRPGGPGWRGFLERAAPGERWEEAQPGGWNVPGAILCVSLGCLGVYGALFATGYWIYGRTAAATACTIVAAASGVLLARLWRHSGSFQPSTRSRQRSQNGL